MRRLAAPAVVAAVLAAALPALADVTKGDVEDARERLRQVSELLAEEVAAYEAALADEAVLQDNLDELRVELTARERELVLARREARDRAAEIYMSAGDSDGAAVSDEVARLPARNVYLAAVSETDREVLNRLELARRDFERQRMLLEDAIADQEALRVEIERLVTLIYTELESANAEYEAVRVEWENQEVERLRLEEEARRLREFLATSTTLPATTTTTRPATTTTTRLATTTTRPPTTTTSATTATFGEGPTSTVVTTVPATSTTVGNLPPGSLVCPVDGATTFTDSWGDPRPGGRAHHGTDLLAAEGTPLVAIESGTIMSPGWHSSGGLGLYIRGDSGDTWYYAHLSAYVGGLFGGLRVGAGQRVGYVGHTGNASTPHLHLGWQPGGGAYQNPYPIVAGLC